jgi:hypothetical protein
LTPAVSCKKDYSTGKIWRQVILNIMNIWMKIEINIATGGASGEDFTGKR